MKYIPKPVSFTHGLPGKIQKEICIHIRSRISQGMGYISSGRTKCQQILHFILGIHIPVVLSFERLRKEDQ